MLQIVRVLPVTGYYFGKAEMAKMGVPLPSVRKNQENSSLLGNLVCEEVEEDDRIQTPILDKQFRSDD